MITENYNQIKCRVVKPSPNRHIYNAASALRLRDYCGMGGGKREKKMKKFDVRLYLLAMSEKLYFIKSHQFGWAKHDLSKYNTNRQTSMDEGKLITRQRSTGH